MTQGSHRLALVFAALAFSMPTAIFADNGTTPGNQKEDSMANETSTTQRIYGTTADGKTVTAVTLRNANGIEVDVIGYGGIITRLITPDRDGNAGDIVLGMDSLADYEAGTPYFGALIGRYGNRIANGRFEIDGQVVQLDKNDGDNHLHGGVEGFDKKVWTMKPFVTEDSAGVVLKLVSEDGDQGYPGTLKTKVVYELTDSDELDMRFHATTDKPTVANLTQHTYFNLAGAGDILGHELEIPALSFTPVGAGLIPTGDIAPVAGTPFDFTTAKTIGEDIGADNAQLELGGGYDHNYVLKTAADDELVLAGRVTELTTGRVLEVLTVEPGVQFYSGNFLDGTLSGKGQTYGHRSGFCLEPQHFPDSPNQPDFPSTVLRPGEDYETRIVYRFSTTD
ncbi:galactose mutarotase [Marinihelvus fidelis]|uniref:Aldose 1-epimerase n=1 Tax=Marinihelvus fidelis TaxID=2613842 RepID=A0A5N0T630_9GAMM|nr:aldose epimerase family protein [Marinihelvus fidelis]KAA9130520.1 galactose mutarotase [Marinihelvus fidelis]